MILVDAEDWRACKENVEKVLSRIVEVRRHVKSNINTKVEIKQNTGMAFHEGKRMEQVWKRVESKSSNVEDYLRPSSGKGTSTEVGSEVPSFRTKPSTRNAQTQTVEQPPATRNDPKNKLTDAELMNVDTFEKFKVIEQKAWGEKFYKVAFKAAGLPYNGNKDTDLVFIGDEVDCPQDKAVLQNEMTSRYPELAELEGRVASLTNTTKVNGKHGATFVRERLVYRVEAGQTNEEWFETLSEMKSRVLETGRKKIAFYPPDRDKKGVTTRKMLECLYRDTGVHCLIYVEDRAEPKKVRRTTPRKTGTEAILVKKEGCSYADLLREVKGRVRPESDAAQAIKTIRESRDGNMVIVVDGRNKEASSVLTQELNKLQGYITRTAGKSALREQVYIRGIDSISTKEDITKAIREMMISPEAPFEVSEPRPTLGGNQTATVRLSDEGARHMLTKGKIRIGLNWCSIEKRVEVTQCYKCWGYGHLKANCSENTDLGDVCKKCGKPGHFHKECREGERCLNCKAVGHRAGSGKCPEFRKALARARLRAKKKKAY